MDYGQVQAYWNEPGRKVHKNDPDEAFASFGEHIAKVMDLAPEDAVLDLGCGDGLIDLHLKGRVGSLVGVDFAERLLEAARQRNPECAYHAQSFLDLLPGGPYDKIFTFNVFQFCRPEDADGFLDNCLAALKPGGSVHHIDVLDYAKMGRWFLRWRGSLRYTVKSFLRYFRYRRDKHDLLWPDGSYWHDAAELAERWRGRGLNVTTADSPSFYKTHIQVYTTEAAS